jgi:very-short-patch-repair endonuclease
VSETQGVYKVSTLEYELSFQMHAAGLPEPVREYVFHPTRKWRFDFALPDLLIAIEVEGGIWSRGRHVRGKGFEEDCYKYAEATLLGWRVFRFTPKMIRSGDALRYVEMAIAKKARIE